MHLKVRATARLLVGKAPHELKRHERHLKPPELAGLSGSISLLWPYPDAGHTEVVSGRSGSLPGDSTADTALAATTKERVFSMG